MVIAAFFPDISQFFVDSPPSKAYPPSKHSCLLSSTCWVVKLHVSTLLPEEVCLLGQYHLLVMISSHPRPENLLAFTNTGLSLGSSMSSSAVHGPIPLSEPFIPTVTYFKILIVKLYVLYVLNMYVKFLSNQMLFTNRSINLFFTNNFKL